MKKEEFVSALKNQSADVRVSSRLRQKTLDAACRKEQIKMKKKVPAIALAIVLSLIFCATALALAGRAGMLDYQRLYPNTYIPENAAESIKQDVLSASGDLVDISIRELYYDGLTSRITVDVTAKDESVFLAGFDTMGSETWSSLNRLNPEFDESDKRTVAEVFTEDGYSSSYTVNIGVYDSENEMQTGSGSYYYTAPGVLTFFMQDSYADDLPEREVDLHVTLVPFLDSEGNEINWKAEDRITMDSKLNLNSSAKDGAAYVNEAPVVLEESGITIEQMEVLVKPQELYVRLYYTLAEEDPDKWLELEFIDPESTAEEPFNQRLAEGLSGDIGGRQLSERGETPVRIIKQFTLGLNELRDSYTVRVFDVDGKERYDTATIAMREATEEDLAAFPSVD